MRRIIDTKAAAELESPAVAKAGPAEPRWKVAVICALLVALVLFIFGKTAHYGFVYDDAWYVADNPVVQQGLTLHGLAWAFTFEEIGHWHPLTWIMHMLDCQVYGVRPGGAHLTNVLLHAAAVVLLFLVLFQMTGAFWRCAFVAAAWAIHPLRAESVAWISERKDVLSGVFFMLALGAYVRCAREPSALRRILVAALFALGLMSKNMLVTFPCVLLLLDYWPLGRLKERSQFLPLLKEKIPLFALSAVSCVITFLGPEETNAAHRLPLWLRVENALISCCIYLRQGVWPAALSVNYPNPTHAFPFWEVAGALVLLCLISAAAYGLRKRRPYLLTGWLWFLGMLAPVIGFVQISHYAHADRYTYLPQIGLSIAGTWLAADVASQWRSRRVFLGTSAAAILCALCVCTWKQVSYWRDSYTLWSHALRCDPFDPVANINLGLVLIDQGETTEGIALYREALRIDPNYEIPHYNLGIALEKLGRTKEAMDEYREALRVNPDYTQAHERLGLALFHQGRIGDAIAEYREALRTNPDYAAAHNGLGFALSQQGLTDEAIAEYHAALRIDPIYADAYDNLANALLQQGHTDEAIANFREALRNDPGNAQTHNNLGNALVLRKQTDAAIAEYREAVRLKPDYANAHYNLGNALLREGQGAGAIQQLQEALKLQPRNVIFENDLALILSTAPQRSLRDGARALELATEANQATGGNDPMILRTLAAAYAETGDFSQAAETARKALDLAEAKPNSNLADALRREIKLYEAGHRFESPP